MRYAIPLALLLTATAVPLAYVSSPALAQAYDKQFKDGKQSKADRKRAEQEAIRSAVQRGEILSMPRILTIAQRRVPGSVVKIELDYEPTGITYEVKILTASGRVREVEIDARTGNIIKIEDD